MFLLENQDIVATFVMISKRRSCGFFGFEELWVEQLSDEFGLAAIFVRLGVFLIFLATMNILKDIDYQAPELELEEVAVEFGYADSYKVGFEPVEKWEELG